jgi:hypothetical protein
VPPCEVFTRARPIDLAINDGIVSMTGGEGYWNGQQWESLFKLLIAEQLCMHERWQLPSWIRSLAEDFTNRFTMGQTIRLAAEGIWVPIAWKRSKWWV